MEVPCFIVVRKKVFMVRNICLVKMLKITNPILQKIYKACVNRASKDYKY